MPLNDFVFTEITETHSNRILAGSRRCTNGRTLSFAPSDMTPVCGELIVSSVASAMLAAVGASSGPLSGAGRPWWKQQRPAAPLLLMRP
jgi:hypothetical protein